MRFFGVNLILQKICSCKKNDKYQVWFFHEEKWEKLDFLKTLLISDFDLLESDYIYIFVHENKKNYHGQFFFSWGMFRTVVSLWQIWGANGKQATTWTNHRLPCLQSRWYKDLKVLDFLSFPYECQYLRYRRIKGCVTFLALTASIFQFVF